MKILNLIRFEAIDGKQFSDKGKCIEYEKLIEEINFIMKGLVSLPIEINTLDFANGEGYIQQNKEVIDEARENLRLLGIKELNIKSSVDWYFIGRYFDDSDNKPLYKAWGRLANCDKYYREWGQGYYALNPTKGIQKSYNKK